MAKLRTFALGSSAWTTSIVIASLVIGLVLAETSEKDFEFDDTDLVKVVKRAADELPALTDDEDMVADEAGSTPGEDYEGSGTVEPVFPTLPGYPVFFRVTIRFTDLVYQPALSDRNSEEFQTLARRLADAIELLFQTIPGSQLVTILQFSAQNQFRPGSVLVTLDLGSQNFNNAEVVKSVLEENIQSGLFGSYGVSSEGFSFKSLDEEVVCPPYVGREPSRLPRNGSNWANLLINNAFPCPGNVVGWEYYRLIPEGRAFVGVWRQVDDREFLLVDKTMLPPAPVGEHSVLVRGAIPVQRGDFIGIFYPRSTANNVIAQATLADNVVPSDEMFQNYFVEFFDEMVTSGNSFDISRVPYSQNDATFAIRALMNYDDDGERPVYTCGSNEFTCDDGYCIQSDYMCDNQDDCPDGSDERNCLRCTDEQFICLSGQCVPLQNRCDGQRDCGDGSDETNCPPVTCSADEFRCLDGSCINGALRCDSRADCPSGDDEFQCPSRECRTGEFRCNDGTCIASSRECDGNPDCPDRSDEDLSVCDPFGPICPEGMFRCEDNECINPRKHCDGVRDCRDGSDEKGCVKCTDQQFTCETGECIELFQRCDGVRHCPDASDEANCPIPGCKPNEFQCDDGSCIRSDLQCDGIGDCDDYSDEFICPCRDDEFTCLDGLCIDASLRCSGQPECEDGSDEQGCPSRTCSPQEFRCDNGQCISLLGRCNSVPDCQDRSDEDDCGCRDNQFTCQTSGRCIDIAKRCDQRPDCEDRSDELNCVCADDEFRCGDGRCIPDSRRCDRRTDCTDGSDEEQCACSQGEFTCVSDRRCIPQDRVCNGVPECLDGSDESDCGCSNSEFTCTVGGRCIPLSRRCDRRLDCEDGSDELRCPCQDNEFTCASDGQCIPTSRVCDQRRDCADGSDERNCECQPLSEFTCVSDGRCIPSSRQCDQRNDCADGSDERNCGCQANEFTCVSDDRCIPSNRVCDRRNDCADGSDERNCACQDSEFTCASDGRCISTNKVCDQRSDCADGSDERNCECQPLSEFTCVFDGSCIPSSRVCDQRNDCADGSDERNCACKDNEFTCASDGRCIPTNRVCDQRSDCADGSDERNCECQPLSEFTCVSDGSCIPSSRVCDQRSDCADGSDERECACGDDEFTCQSDRRCISSLRRCDRRRDCADGSDEENCPCRQDQFTCETTGECIPAGRKCDRRMDCADGSDERDCAPLCREEELECDGRCLPQQYICNGRPECRDGRDEQNCPSCDVETEFQCVSDGRCIPTVYRCNGRAECTDESDEDNCASRIQLVVNPQNVRVRIGQTAIFFCEAVGVGSSSVRVRWSRADNQRLPASASDDGQGRLTLRGVTQEDAGDYVCSATGVAGNFQTTARLQVDYIGPPTDRPPSGNCRADEATCSNGQCIPRDYLCDGEQDCSDGSDEVACSRPLPCEPNEFKCNNGRCAWKIWRCDGDNDCGDGSDESYCPSQLPGEKCRMDQFMCQRGDQCVPASYQCDGEYDCQDRSDEIGCSVPTIIKPPVPEIEVEINGTFTIYCEAVGVPTPLIVWRLNWGNIPTGDRVTITSVDGHGSLTINYARPEDAGAYTCEALNNQGSIFATPDALIIVRRIVGVCKPPRFNAEAGRQDECVRCFCFGHTETCYSSNLQISQITLGSKLELVRRATLLPVEEASIQYVSSSGDFFIQDFDRTLPSGSYYWSLPQQYLGNMLTSYGGDLSYRVQYDVDGFDIATNDPDVIVEGNDITLFYRRDTTVPPGSSTTVRVPLVETDWEKSEGPIRGDVPISQLATRQDFMLALQNISRILIRATYDNRQQSIRIGNVLLSTAVSQATNQGRAVYVEECSCPTGYSGLSCENCAPGFYRVRRGRYLGSCVPCNCNGHSNDCHPETGVCLNCLHSTEGAYCDQCARGYVGDARRGTPNDCELCPCPLTIPSNQFSPTCIRERDGEVTCTACPPGYSGRRCESCLPSYRGNPLVPGDRCTLINRTDTCDTRGSLTAVPSDITGRCDCKANVEGQLCERCRADTFYLSDDYPFGCVPCFCMGVTQMCQSTSWNRAQVVVSFTNDRSDVSLTNMMQTREVTQGFYVDRSNRELVYRRFSGLPQDTYYWKLPQRFLGDKVTAYGGSLRFTVRHRPGADSAPISLGEPIVELGGNDIILVYREDRQVSANTPQSFSIPFYERDWLRIDGEPANREHLLMALADLDFILIRATYTRTTDEASLSDVSLDIAENRITGQDRAFPVEQCNCPPGYRGLSCEDCDTGYTRSGGGLYLGLCMPCRCNGHSNECDPETGICRNCRHNTQGDSCQRCGPGYYGNATRGSVNDCQKCPCPLTESPNQFSPTCNLDVDGQVTCDACPVGHTGRRCDRCVSGYQGNPMQPGDYCKKIVDRCDCDPRGTIPNTQCDPVTSQCQCKAYVHGRRCGSCQDGYFNLEESNQQGCLSCFCMGITNDCSSSSYSKEVLRPQFNPDGSHSFSLTNRRMSRTITDGFVMDASRNEIIFNNFEGIQQERESLFIQLPPKFRGDKVSAYGGQLRFTLSYSTAFDAGQSYMDVDLEIISNGQRMYLLFNPSLKPQETQDYEFLMRESSFRLLDGSQPTREAFLTILANIDAFLIRATYNSIMSSISLRNLEMEIAVPRITGLPPAAQVESCRCPEGYTGLSCQACAAGFLRVPDASTALGRCVRCSCNSHATSCDPVSGRCMDCQHNTVGDRCDKCAPGYYGDPSAGTPYDCRSCPCPLTLPGNQFSPTCYLDRDQNVTCDQCPPGYTGRDCGSCAPGYQGNPRDPGGRCSRDDVDRRPTVVVSPITLQEPLGSRVRFQCRVGGRGPFNVLWSRLDGRSLPGRSTTGIGPNYELVINGIQYSDAGRYVCTATNNYGNSRGITELNVERPGQQLRVMIEEPRQIVSSVGATVRFVCVAVSYSSEANYVLSWSKEGGILPARATDQNGVLVIPNLREEDAGQYVCTGSDPLSVDRATAVISVQDVDRSPTARIEPRYLEVIEGGSAEFRCIVEGTPAPSIRWTRGADGPLPDYASVQDGVLRIPSVRMSDQSEYHCHATNPAGSASVRTIIYVTPRPDTGPVDITIIIRRAQLSATIGSDVQLECYAQNNQNVQLVWSRQGGLPAGSNQVGGVLTIPNVQPSYSGNYMCTGTGPAGNIGSATAVITVIPGDNRQPPTARIEPDRLMVSQGTTGTLRCVVTGIPRPTVTWSRARGDLTANHNVQGEILRISQATMDDRGIYICTVSNVAGRAQSSAIVDIERRQSPQIELYPSVQQTIQPGASALFQCRTTGGMPAPTITWTRVGGKEFTSTTKLMNGDNVIMFERVTGEEQGGYICTASNSAGTVTLTASLVVEGPPTITVKPGKRITAIVGERVNIECVGEGEPIPTVFWRKETARRSDVLPESYAPTPGTAGLLFDPADLSDSGRYTCIARNERGEAQETVDLNVTPTGLAPLVDIEGPDRMTLVEGETVELSCRATGLRNPLVRWRRPNGLPLPPGHSVTGGQLYIPRITSEYQGVYECIVSSERGDYSASVILIVSVTPRLTVSPSQMTARTGDSVRLNCQPSGSGPFQIEWQKVGGVLPPGVREYDGVLQIPRVTAADAGQYRCIATSDSGTSEGFATLRVAVTPQVSVSPKEENRQLGSTVEFRCIVSGDPPPSIRWEKDGGSLPPQHQIRNGVLVLYNVQREDEGRYICTASSDSGVARDYVMLRISDIGNIGSKIGQSKQTVEVGDRVEFECIVTGTPTPTVQWSKLEGSIPSTAIIGEELLVIPDVRPEHAGTYRCTATNVAGSVQSEVQLYVQSKPIVSQQQDLQTAALGSPTTLTCDTYGSPQPQITWVKKGGDLPVEHRIEQNGGLYIPRVREQDAGEYECRASSNLGQAVLPVVLVIGAFVPYFPQNPNSYMSFQPLKDVYIDLDILLSFRPEATDGMVLYNGQYSSDLQDAGHDRGDFVCFGLNGAYPEFRFDVGSGPAIIRGQNPLQLNRWHTVHLKRQSKNGTLLVNDEPAYYGEAPGRFVGMDIVQPMYLGGVPNYQEIPRAAGISSGFVGSIGQVRLKGVPLNLGNAAIDLYGVEQYDACRDAPCYNGGHCQIHNNAYGFRCQCPRGYAGQRCESVGYRCYPGACGEGRCYDFPDGSGFQCICPRGYSGEGCRIGLTVVDPAFNKTSFISYPTIENSLQSVSLKLDFKPRSRNDGIILYNAQKEDGRGDFVAIIMKDGFVEFRFDTGKGPAILRSRQQLAINEWATVTADRKGRDGMLIVNQEDPVNEQVDSYYDIYSRRDRGDVFDRGSASGSTVGLNLKQPLFLGGVDPAETLSANVGATEGFVGCIAKLEVNSRDIDLMGDALESVNIGDCGDRSQCDRKPCMHGGLCQEVGQYYRCICPDSYTGENCEIEINDCLTRMPCLNDGICSIAPNGGYRCSCSLGYMGRDCETDVSVGTTFEVEGDGFVEFERSLLPHRRRQAGESIKFTITTVESDGLLFWQGQAQGEQSGADYLAILIRDGFVEFRYELGSGPAVLISNIPVNDGYPHSIEAKRLNRDGTLIVDRDHKVNGSTKGPLQVLNVQGNIFFGGVPDLEEYTDGQASANFNGCIRDIQIKDEPILDIGSHAVGGVNVRPCLN